MGKIDYETNGQFFLGRMFNIFIRKMTQFFIEKIVTFNENKKGNFYDKKWFIF
jgi:hypothetical protein